MQYNLIDKIVFTGIGLGVIFDLIVNPAMLYFESDKKEFHPYILHFRTRFHGHKGGSRSCMVVTKILHNFITYTTYIAQLLNKKYEKPFSYVVNKFTGWQR